MAFCDVHDCVMVPYSSFVDVWLVLCLPGAWFYNFCVCPSAWAVDSVVLVVSLSRLCDGLALLLYFGDGGLFFLLCTFGYVLLLVHLAM